MPNVSGTPPPSSMHQHNTQHKTVPQHNYIKNRDYPYNEDTNARNVASSASTIREGNTPTRDSIPVHDGTHLKVSILREKNTSTNLWPKTFVWKHAAKPDREGYTTRSQKPMQTMDI
jgi:hypothetical protein